MAGCSTPPPNLKALSPSPLMATRSSRLRQSSATIYDTSDVMLLSMGSSLGMGEAKFPDVSPGRPKSRASCDGPSPTTRTSSTRCLRPASPSSRRFGQGHNFPTNHHPVSADRAKSRASYDVNVHGNLASREGNDGTRDEAVVARSS